MYFFAEADMKGRSIAPGVDIKVVSGDNAMLSFVTLTPGSSVPLHSHPHEQLGLVLDGEFVFVIGDERRVVKKGDTYVIPSNVLHGVPEVPVLSKALDVFSPPRQEYR